MDSKTSQCQEHNIEALLEWLGFLQIIKEASEKTIEYTNKILTALVPVNQNNKQEELPKNMVPDLGWFDRDRTKFKD